MSELGKLELRILDHLDKEGPSTAEDIGRKFKLATYVVRMRMCHMWYFGILTTDVQNSNIVWMRDANSDY